MSVRCSSRLLITLTVCSLLALAGCKSGDSKGDDANGGGTPGGGGDAGVGGTDHAMALYIADQDNDNMYQVFTQSDSDSEIAVYDPLFWCGVVNAVSWTPDKSRIL